MNNNTLNTIFIYHENKDFMVSKIPRLHKPLKNTDTSLLTTSLSYNRGYPEIAYVTISFTIIQI